MNLVIINQYALPSGASGITRHGDLGAELVRRGHSVTVIASRFNYLTRHAADVGLASETHDGVRFRWLHTGVYRGNDGRRLRSMLSFTARSIAAGWRLEPRPDVILASSPHLLVVVTGLVLARRHRVPLTLEIRDLWPSALVDLGAIRRGSLVHRALSLLERVAYRAADLIVIVPPHADRRVRELGTDPARCVAVPNAASAERAEPTPIPDTLAAVFDAHPGDDILLYTGAQGVSNGLGVVIDALDVLGRDHPAVYDRLSVVLVGDGGDHDRLVALAAERGHRALAFHQPIAKSCIPAALERASLLLVAFAEAPVYDYGVSPNKLFDYMAAGRPVVLASRLSDTPVHEADAGATYDPASASSLAEAVVGLMGRSPAERHAMGARARDLVAARYTIGVTGGLLEAALLSITAPGRP